MEGVKEPLEQQGFQVLPHRRVVERTIAWLGRYRRQARRGCEANPRNSEAWIKVAPSDLMLREMAKKQASEQQR